MNALAAVVSRRQFLQVSLSASGALVLAPAATQGAWAAEAPARLPENPLGLLIRIEPDNRVVIGATGAEIGQGVKTSLPMILADELDADWSLVTVEQMPLSIDFSGEQPRWRWGAQGAGGSTSIPDALGRAAPVRCARPMAHARIGGRALGHRKRRSADA